MFGRNSTFLLTGNVDKGVLCLQAIWFFMGLEGRWCPTSRAWASSSQSARQSLTFSRKSPPRKIRRWCRFCPSLPSCLACMKQLKRMKSVGQVTANQRKGRDELVTKERQGQGLLVVTHQSLMAGCLKLLCMHVAAVMAPALHSSTPAHTQAYNSLYVLNNHKKHHNFEYSMI